MVKMVIAEITGGFHGISVPIGMPLKNPPPAYVGTTSGSCASADAITIITINITIITIIIVTIIITIAIQCENHHHH